MHNYLLQSTERGDVVLYWRLLRVPLGDGAGGTSEEIWCGRAFGWRPSTMQLGGRFGRVGTPGVRYKSERGAMQAAKRLAVLEWTEFLSGVSSKFRLVPVGGA